MKINLTKLLFIDSRIIRINEPEPYTTGCFRYVQKIETTGGNEPYSFVLNEREAV